MGPQPKDESPNNSYKGYQNGEGITLLGNEDNEEKCQEFPTFFFTRSVWMSLMLILGCGLLVGSIAMHGHPQSPQSGSITPANNNDDTTMDSGLPPTGGPGDTESGGVQARDFDGDKIKDGTTLADLNQRSASIEIASGCETTLVIVRHCEKQGPSVADKDHNQHCSYVGHQRAHYLTTLFGTAPNQWPAPSFLYSLTEQRNDHVNYRMVETLQPLSAQLKLDILKYDTNKEMAAALLEQIASGQLCGKVALISWEHSIIGDLASRLGCRDCPKNYLPDSEFDQVWMIRYVYDVLGTPVFQDKHPIDAEDNAAAAGNDRETQGEDATKKEKPKTTTSKGNTRRHLKKGSSSKTTEAAPNPEAPPAKQWSIFSTIASQNFDPLKFSNSAGDYDGSGAPGGKWLHQSTSVSTGGASTTGSATKPPASSTTTGSATQKPAATTANGGNNGKAANGGDL